MDERPHGDVEEIVRELLLNQLVIENEPLSEDRIGGFPEPGTEYAPFYIAIESGGGRSDYFTQEPTIDIDVFAPRRSTAKSIAFAIQLIMLRYPWSVRVESGQRYTIDRVVCDAGPVKMPWADQSIRRQLAQYTLILRR